MTYGYVRVSSQTQNIARQMEEMYKLGLTNKFIYIDKQSGKDFERKNYQKLKRKLKKDDLLIIKSIDRMCSKYLETCSKEVDKEVDVLLDDVQYNIMKIAIQKEIGD